MASRSLARTSGRPYQILPYPPPAADSEDQEEICPRSIAAKSPADHRCPSERNSREAASLRTSFPLEQPPPDRACRLERPLLPRRPDHLDRTHRRPPLRRSAPPPPPTSPSPSWSRSSPTPRCVSKPAWPSSSPGWPPTSLSPRRSSPARTPSGPSPSLLLSPADRSEKPDRLQCPTGAHPALIPNSRRPGTVALHEIAQGFNGSQVPEPRRLPLSAITGRRHPPQHHRQPPSSSLVSSPVKPPEVPAPVPSVEKEPRS